MGLNDIRLTPQLLADLYGKVLIETVGKPKENDAIKTVGNNEKNILIVVNSEGEIIVSETDLAFLSSILTACKLRLEDVAIINRSTVEEKGHKAVLHQLESRFVLLFDVTPPQFGLPMDFPPFQVQAFDTRQYLHAPALQKIREHKGLKTELWNALKKLFML